MARRRASCSSPIVELSTKRNTLPIYQSEVCMKRTAMCYLVPFP